VGESDVIENITLKTCVSVELHPMVDTEQNGACRMCNLFAAAKSAGVD
jgi:hypothetical protein